MKKQLNTDWACWPCEASKESCNKSSIRLARWPPPSAVLGDYPFFDKYKSGPSGLSWPLCKDVLALPARSHVVVLEGQKWMRRRGSCPERQSNGIVGLLG